MRLHATADDPSVVASARARRRAATADSPAVRSAVTQAPSSSASGSPLRPSSTSTLPSTEGRPRALLAALATSALTTTRSASTPSMASAMRPSPGSM